jgi:aminoglycoside phosphotransferase (APT) family kinase protein
MPKVRLEDPAVRGRLAKFVSRASGKPVTDLVAVPLSGGAIQENWLVTLNLAGERQELVLRTDAPTGVSLSHGRAQEFALLQAAQGVGVTVPEPLWLCREADVIGQDFYLMRRVYGEARGYRVVKDKSLGGDRRKLA